MSWPGHSMTLWSWDGAVLREELCKESRFLSRDKH